MKKYAYILFAVIILLSIHSVKSQVINGGFENWTYQTFYETPDSFFTTSSQSFLSFGTSNVSKETDSYSGNYAVKMETTGFSGNFIPGGLFIGIPGDDGISGGLPFSEKPDSVRLFAKYNILPGDTGFCYIVFKLAGNPVGMSLITFTGIQNSFLKIISEIVWFGPVSNTPDTITVAIVSSSPETSVNPGNILIIDSISLIGSISQIPNSDFEYWTISGAEEPDNWITSNAPSLNTGTPSVTKSSDSFEGLYAACLENTLFMNSDTLSFITNGHLGPDGPEGGMPVTQNPDVLSFYYKYIPVGPDTALASLTSYRYDTAGDSAVMIEEIIVKLLPASDYTYFEIQATYDSLLTADTVNIAFAAGNVEEDTAYAGLGSVLYIDNVGLTLKPVKITEYSALTGNYNVFPNPAKDKVFINTGNNQANSFSFRLFDSFGRLIINRNLKIYSADLITIDIKDIDTGYYTYSIQSSEYISCGKLCIIE